MSRATSIEWADKTWNPINGRCPNACDYCYMWGKGGIGNRFAEVHDHPLRLDENVLARVPKTGTVFVGSSTDMWHPSAPDEWILSVLNKINRWAEDYQWDYSYNPYDYVRYLFLTKNPTRYLKIDVPQDIHLWYGTTWDGLEKTRDNIHKIAELSLFGYNTFISFEPLLNDPREYLVTLDYSSIKWIIIGADSRRGQPKPPKEWADFLAGEARRVGAKVFIKDNYGYPEKIKELPF